MTTELLTAAGGVGLFLVGITLLTDGLRALAGAALRRTLRRWTASPLSGAIAGAITTAVIQSSSATTVTVVGFVGAGLLPFSSALGVILGANVGTTATGWLVALLGFKLDLGLAASPLLLLAALLRLFAGGATARVGQALAGFSLLFLGVEAMKTGLAGFEGVVTPDSFPGDDLIGRLQLVAIGALVTLVTQSSSAGVATALAALSAGAISLPQASAVVIGMNVGTTFTAILATLGGSTAMRRTGLAHVVYNVVTALGALALLTPFAALIAAGPWANEPSLALVAFHTAFNVVGVALALPLAGPFARLIERLVPEEPDSVARRLDRRLLKDPAAAMDAAAGAVDHLAREGFALARSRLEDGRRRRRPDPAEAERMERGVAALQDFLEQGAAAEGDAAAHRRLEAALHAMDHLSRLAGRCAQTERVAPLAEDARLARLGAVAAEAVRRALADDDISAHEARLDRVRRLLRREREGVRTRTVAAAAGHGLTPEAAIARLDAVRWLHRTVYHLWRIAHHLGRLREPAPEPTSTMALGVETVRDEG